MNKKRMFASSLLVVYIMLLITLLVMIFPSAMQVIRYRVFDNMDLRTAITSILAIITLLTFLLITLLRIGQKFNSKDDNLGVAYMDDDRKYLEQQINDLNKKLISTEDRLLKTYHLVLSSQDKQVNTSGKISTDAFLEGFGINVDKIEVQGDLAFILTPFHDDFQKTYDVISHTCTGLKLRPMRGDEEYIASDILKHIVNQVVRSRLVIAVLDGRNPNVFYELGIVHSLNKPTILLANVSTPIPFDLQNQYLVLYENNKDLQEKLQKAILNILTLKA